jgi:LacI family transcriptional regulator
MEITTKDIARICGVSRGTVDRAINNRSGINPVTKEKILSLIKEVGYRPDHLARSLAKGKTYTIGVIVFDLYNRFFSQLVNTVENVAHESKYFISLAITDKDPIKERLCIEHLVSRKVDGIILMTVQKGRPFEQYLKSINIPLVTIINKISNNWTFVGIDDLLATRDAVEFLAGRGYKNIVYISPPLKNIGTQNLYALEQRLAGYREGLRYTGLNIKPAVLRTDDFKIIYQTLKDSLQREKTALLLSADIYALEALNFLKTKGISVPEDVGIMGFDNIDVLKYVTPQLSTVAYHIEEIGRAAVNYLIKQIKKTSFTRQPDIIVSHTVIEGKSV